jgi:hypothetical protein
MDKRLTFSQDNARGIGEGDRHRLDRFALRRRAVPTDFREQRDRVYRGDRGAQSPSHLRRDDRGSWIVGIDRMLDPVNLHAPTLGRDLTSAATAKRGVLKLAG